MTRRSPLPILLLGLVLGSCDARPPVPPEAVLGVGGTFVTYEAFVSYLGKNEGEDSEALGSDVLSALLDQFLEEEILLRWARGEGLLRGREERREALTAVVSHLAELVPEPSTSAVSHYFESHRDQFLRPERVELGQILVDDQDLAVAARERWESGESFQSLAREMSQDPTAPFGGRQGVFRREDLPDEVAAAVFSLGEGEVSEVVRTPSGYHVFQVIRRLPQGLPQLSEVEPEILALLRQQALDQELRRLVTEGARRYNVRIYEENLPFEYRGDFLEVHKSDSS